MAQFKASLRDVDGLIDISISEDKKTITIVEHSNYDDASPEAGHARSFFTDYRKVIVSSPSKKFVFSSIAAENPDVAIDPPSVGDSPYAYTIDDVDGNYKIKLISVPTWDNGVAYTLLDDNTFHDGKLYKAINSGSGSQPDLNPSDWEEITQDEVASKYNTQETVVLACTLDECWQRKVTEAVCFADEGKCNVDQILANKKFVDAQLLIMIKDLLPGRVANLDFQKTSCFLELSNQICGC